MESQSSFNGVAKLLAVSPPKELPKLVNISEDKHITENGGDAVVMDNGTSDSAEKSGSPEVDSVVQDSDVQTNEEGDA